MGHDEDRIYRDTDDTVLGIQLYSGFVLVKILLPSYFPAAKVRHERLAGTALYCLAIEAHLCERHAQHYGEPAIFCRYATTPHKTASVACKSI